MRRCWPRAPRLLPLAVVLARAPLTADPLPAQASRTITGRALEARDSSIAAGIIVRIAGTPLGAVTDSTGHFRLSGAPASPVRVVFTGVTFRPDTVTLPAGRDTLTVYLQRVALSLAPLEVRGEAPLIARVRFDDLAQTSTVTLSPQEIRRVPGVLEPDVIRAVQLLPGTVSRNDYTIGYNVRGGESDQNLIELDGIPVFNPSHLGGLFSTFDADAIARTDFLTGGFPATYSGRLSSVLDIKLRDGARDRVHGAGQVSLLSSKLLLEGPLPGGASFLASARRTYLDAVVSAFTPDVLPYYFTDLLGKVSLPTGRAGSLALTGYFGRDALNFELVKATDIRDPVRLAFDWGNRLAGADWRISVGGLGVEARAGLSQFSTTLGLLPNLARFDNTARLQFARLALRPGMGPRHQLAIGAEVERYDMTYDVSSPTLQTAFFSARYRPTVWAAFVDEQWAPRTRLLVRPGLRIEHVPQAGFTGVSPRLASKLFLTRDLALTGSAGRYFQAIQSIRDQELPITIYEFWIGADADVPVARSDHLVLGIERWFGRSLHVALEGYHKTFVDLVRPNRGQDLRRQGDEFIPATGEAWGFDVLVRRHLGAVRGWIAYTFAKAERTVQGLTYPPAHDRRHTVNIVLEAPGPLGSGMGVRWGFGSPLPYTPFIGQWDHRQYNATDNTWDDWDREPIAGPINGARFPSYSRLDVSFHWAVNRLGARWEPYVQIVNAYNRTNAFLYFFDYGDAPPTRTGVSQLPFLPTFGMVVRF